jgi:hypothetical protein
MVCTLSTPLGSNVSRDSWQNYERPLTFTDDTILDSWQVGPNRPPIDTHHPAVRTHPVTGLKALNVNNGFVTAFAELKKDESDKLLDFFKLHIHAADDHYVRWKWAVGSVAMWDNVSLLAEVILKILTWILEMYCSSRHPRKLRQASKRCPYNCFWRKAYDILFHSSDTKFLTDKSQHILTQIVRVESRELQDWRMV